MIVTGVIDPYKLAVQGLDVGFNVGDVFEIPGVYQIDFWTRRPGKELQQFVITAQASSNAEHISLYPSMAEFPTVYPKLKDSNVTRYPSFGDKIKRISSGSPDSVHIGPTNDDLNPALIRSGTERLTLSSLISDKPS